ncbi:MAG TPA: EAL domain-containing protein [Allosphingosinicella sp.]|jgi:EAL domain-containing protein (putative c-di-GMP-specific phosphodiesterase class I)
MATNALAHYLSARDGAPADAQIESILDAVRKHLGMEIAFAARYENGHRTFTHISAGIPVPAAPGDSEPQEQSFCWNILQGHLPELIHNAADLPFAKTLPITMALPVGCHLDVPLRMKDGSIYGSFCCLSRTPDYSLTERDLDTVRAFAALAADLIETSEAAKADRRATRDRIEQVIGAAQPVVHLQPIHCLATGRSIGAEALARFEDRRAPNLWFDEAWSGGLGVELELAAIRNALAALPYVPRGCYLSINASPETILSGRVLPLLQVMQGRDIVIEVTEHSRVEDYQALAAALAPLRPYARIAVDDVGAGYAGLRHILALEADILKLDMSLTRGIDSDPAKRALAVAMVSFADRTGCAIVAEGVETAEERRVLQELGVLYGQGWLFSRAMPVTAAHQHLLGASSIAEPTRAYSAARAAAA